MAESFSIIVPVYNRPDELRDLLTSIRDQEVHFPVEVVIVEDGSTELSESVVATFQSDLDILYLNKPNTGPGDSRNYGMERAHHDYFIILDSDCILRKNYLSNVHRALSEHYVDCFGGPDTAHESFSDIQKAIDYSLTSFITTGGIRGRVKSVSTFEPRSFNMGLSRTAFKAVGGFGDIHPGEDPDLVWRLRKAGFKTAFIANAVVYHKRRINFKKFFTQVHKFGKVRPILSKWHPRSARLTHWFPTVFIFIPILGIILALFGLIKAATWMFAIMGLYFIAVMSGALNRTGSFAVALMAVVAVCIQFVGYGTGFLKSVILLTFSRKEPRELFPELFFK